MTNESVHHKQRGALVRVRAVRWIAVADLITLVGTQREAAAILELDFERAREAEEHMPFGAPVVGTVSRRVLENTHSNIAEILSAPEGESGFPGMATGLELSPVGGAHGQRRHLHRPMI